MSTSDVRHQAPDPRRRLSREQRRRQLLDSAWRLVREDGADALTLGRLAEQSGVTKPVVYDHFGARNGLLVALYEEFETRQTADMEAALDAGEPTLAARAMVLASCYIDCVQRQGVEIPGVIAALGSSPELQDVKLKREVAVMERCRTALAPFAEPGAISSAGLRGLLGAAEALSFAAVTGEITTAEAEAELYDTIVGLVARSTRGPEAARSQSPAS